MVSKTALESRCAADLVNGKACVGELAVASSGLGVCVVVDARPSS